MIELRAEPMAALRERIEFFREGVEKVIHRSKCEFVADDVYREVTTGGVTLLWVYANGNLVGFSVCSEYRDRYSQKHIICVDISYLAEEGWLGAYADAMLSIAREGGADRLEWYSARPGWSKVMASIGYSHDASLYAREVTHG